MHNEVLIDRIKVINKYEVSKIMSDGRINWNDGYYEDLLISRWWYGECLEDVENLVNDDFAESSSLSNLGMK